MKSFITGSQRYGTPTPDSDTDLVVLVDEESLIVLIKASAQKTESHGAQETYYEDGCSIRFGKLNLLCVTEKKHFDIWQQGTDELVAMRPVSREKAIDYLAALRKKNQIEGW